MFTAGVAVGVIASTVALCVVSGGAAAETRCCHAAALRDRDERIGDLALQNALLKRRAVEADQARRAAELVAFGRPQ